MKCKYKSIGLSRICRLFGIPRQAYYQHSWEALDIQTADVLILKEVTKIRKDHKVVGTGKLCEFLHSFKEDHSIKMGRDALFDLLAANKMLVRKRKRKVQTTYSNHWLHKYPNLIREFIPKGINQLWVSDITYWKIQTGEHLYISLITDAYSRKIVGYNVAETMVAIESVRALHMALLDIDRAVKPWQLTHHSDRGLQYCSGKYVKLLQDNEIRISMTENGAPLENALAERINGILKEEYLNHYKTNTLEEAEMQLKRAIHLYNEARPHSSISNLTPNLVHNDENLCPKRLWKNYYTKQEKLATENEELSCQPITGFII